MNCRNLFDDSNIEPYDYEKLAGVLEVMLIEKGLTAQDIKAVSNGVSKMVVVHTSGVTLGAQRGAFNKRVEIGPDYPFSTIGRITKEQPGLREFSIKAYDHSGSNLFEAKWGTGGPVTAQHAIHERDRMFTFVVAGVGAH